MRCSEATRNAVIALVVLNVAGVDARAQSLDEAVSSAPAASAPEGGPGVADGDDLNNLLDMADKDISQLGQVNVSSQVQATAVDPVVEGVSKKQEVASEAPGIVEVITAEDIEQFGAKNLYEVLQRGSSVFMTGSFLFRRNVASMRGNLQNHEDNHVLILVNGRPFRDVTAGGVNVSMYTAFPIHTIERVEIIRGPGSVLYGTNAFNGVINIVTKNPDEPTVYAGTLTGSYGWQSYSLAAGNGNESQGAYAGAAYSRQKGWPFAATEDVAGPPPLDFDSSPWGEDNVGAFAMYRSGNFTANVFAARASEEQLGPDAQWPSERLNDPRVFCDLGYFLELDDWQSIQTNFTYNFDGTSFPSTFPGLTFRTRSNSYLLESNYRAELTDDLGFLLGGLVDFHEGLAFIDTLPDSVPQYSEIWYGAYMQLEYQTFEWLKLVGGMQANLPGDIKSGIVPRFGAIATLDEHWTGKFLYGQAFRSPYQLERSVVIPTILLGNPGLVPETIQTFDVQLAYRTEDFRFAATYFHSDYFDVISRSAALPQVYFNGGSMTFDGVELENNWQLTDRWRTISSVTYQTNERDGVSNTTSAPNWMAKMGLAYYDEASGLNVGLFDSFFGDQTVPATATTVNPDPRAYHLMSLNSTLDLSRWFNWRTPYSFQGQFLVQNLLDENIYHVEFERELINSLPADAGRTYYGGLTIGY